MSQLAILVNKLGHQLEEIRSRALHTIISKLDYGLITERQLADKDNLFPNLIKLFQYENVPFKEDVLKLILRILKNTENDAGVLLLKADPSLTLLREITDHDILVQDIINLTSKQVNSARYGRSEIDSTAKTTSKNALNSPRTKSSVVTEDLSRAQPSKPMPPKSSAQSMPIATWNLQDKLPSARTNGSSSSSHTTDKEELSARSKESEDWASRVIWSLPQVHLVASDLHVISAVQDSLDNLSSVPQTCHFFTTVMIHDFPPEVFLQHPGVIRQMLRLVKKSTPINTAAVECLSAFTQRLHNRLLYCSQLEFATNKPQRLEGSWEDEDPTTSTPRDVEQQYQQEGYLSSSSDQQNPSKAPEPLTIPQYCLATLTSCAELLGRVQSASVLVMRVLKLTRAVLPEVHHLWQHTPTTKQRSSSVHDLAHFLLEALTTVIKQSVSYEAVVELHAIALGLRIIEALVPIDLSPSVLPSQLQEIICFSLVDPILAINYPQLHNISLSYALVLKRKGTLVYQDIATVMEAMEASVKFSQEAAALPPEDAFEQFRSALPAMPFHQELSLIEQFAQYVMERSDLSDSEVEQAVMLIRSLLAHAEKSIATEAYRVCHNIITSALGPRQALRGIDPCPRLWFIINTSVLVEIVCHGIINTENQISQNAEDIIVYVLKCQMLVSAESWRRVLEQLQPTLPLLQCHAGKSTPLGRATLAMSDPDIAGTASLSSLQVLAGNCRLLFHKDPLCREEAATRLLWLTRLSNLPHKRLADICVIDSAITAHTPISGMYEVGSVVRVLEVLSGPCVEARVQQSALTQLSVMMEDSRLHQIFMEQHGIELFIQLLEATAVDLKEGSSAIVIPIAATLKHLARHNSKARQLLTNDEQFLLTLLKCMSQLAEWRLQRDGAQLLALLLYADFILSSATSLSLPQLCVQSLVLPFACQAHWTVSPNTTSSLKSVVMGQLGAGRLLALQWLVARQGLEAVLQLAEVPPDFCRALTISLQAVRQVQHSHVTHNCRLLLYSFQNATSHDAASTALNTITSYLELHWLVDPEPLSSLPWMNTFRRFILTPPSCQDDFSLLLMVLKFLTFLLGVSPGQSVWVTEALQTPPHTLMKLIVTANSSHVRSDQDVWKKICMSTVELCKTCVQQGCRKGWRELAHLIFQCLGYSHTQHFYSLALLDSKLDCLLAAVQQETDSSISVLWQLLTAFHCESPLSFMGLSITRHTVLCLNKLLSQTQEWERKFLGVQNLSWLPALCSSRDVVVRAAALQLLSGLARSVRGAGTILQLRDDLFPSVLRIVIDHLEASLVREHAAILLANIVKNSPSKEHLISAQKLNLYQEFGESVSLVAVSPVTTHSDPRSGMLYTHPRFVKAGCWLINNLLVSSKDTEAKELVVSSGLAVALFRTLTERDKVTSLELVNMLAAVCKLLTHLCSSCEPTLLEESLPAVLRLLDPATFDLDAEEVDLEVKGLWLDSLRLMRAVLTHCDSETVLPSATVDTLCRCITDTASTALRSCALTAVPAVTKLLTPGAEVKVCEALLSLWQTAPDGKVRSAMLVALTSLLGHSAPATEVAVRAGLLASALTGLYQLHLALTVQTSSTEKLRKNSRSLEELEQRLMLVNSILCGSEESKRAAADQGLADLVHKLWLWCHVDQHYLVLALDLLITFTALCPAAAHSLVLTSTLSGVGQRKTPTSHSLVHALATLLTKEQHPLAVNAKALTLLSHCCQAHECRIIIAKSGLLVRWSDYWNNRKQVQEDLELCWLKFILVFTSTQEGQISVPKSGELFSQLIQCGESRRVSCSALAVAILRNLAAHSSNRPRFLSTRSSLVLLSEKLLSGSDEEKRDSALTFWALAGNHQRAKVALRGLGLVSRLQLAAATTDDHIFTFVADLLKPS